MPLLPPRRLTLTFLLLLFAAVWESDQARAEEALKPSDVFLQGFMMLREVRKLEMGERYAEAARKCREASEMYDSIARRWPAWQTEMLESRRKKVRGDYRRLQQLAIEQGSFPDEATGDQRGDGLPQRESSSAGASIQPRLTKPGGIARAPRTATPRQRFEQLQREVDRLRADRARLIRQSQDQVDNAAAANRSLGVEREKVARLREQLSQAETELSRLEGTGVVALKNQVDELREQLALATEKLKEQNEQTNQVLESYAKAQETIAELTLIAEDLTQQRDEMAAIIKGLQTEDSSLDLITENARLREQLNAAQARVDELEFSKLESDAEITRLREEVSQLRLELATVKAENEAYKQRMLALQGSLDETGRELSTQYGPIEQQTRLENELLRDIIRRQLKQQAFRQQKRALFIEELEGLQSGSDDLIAKIDTLAQEVSLSEAERALLDEKRTEPEMVDTGSVSSGASTLGEGAVDQKVRRFAEAAAYNFGLGRFESALAHYEDILEFAPQDVETLCNLGVTKIRLNQVEAARGLFDRAILSNGQSSRAHFMHGVASFHLDDTEAAVASIRKAIGIEPNDPELSSFLGVVHLVRAEWKEAVETLTMAVDLQPRHATAHYNLSYALLNGGSADPQRALEHYQKAVKHGLAPNERMETYFRKLQGSPTDGVPDVPAS